MFLSVTLSTYNHICMCLCCHCMHAQLLAHYCWRTPTIYKLTISVPSPLLSTDPGTQPTYPPTCHNECVLLEACGADGADELHVVALVHMKVLPWGSGGCMVPSVVFMVMVGRQVDSRSF